VTLKHLLAPWIVLYLKHNLDTGTLEALLEAPRTGEQ
jgi:hypothetical protein